MQIYQIYKEEQNLNDKLSLWKTVCFPELASNPNISTENANFDACMRVVEIALGGERQKTALDKTQLRKVIVTTEEVWLDFVKNRLSPYMIANAESLETEEIWPLIRQTAYCREYTKALGCFYPLLSKMADAKKENSLAILSLALSNGYVTSNTVLPRVHGMLLACALSSNMGTVPEAVYSVIDKAISGDSKIPMGLVFKRIFKNGVRLSENKDISDQRMASITEYMEQRLLAANTRNPLIPTDREDLDRFRSIITTLNSGQPHLKAEKAPAVIRRRRGVHPHP